MSKKNFPKIVVTGSNGFLGTHLLEKLLEKYNVIGINNVLDKKRKGYFPLKKEISRLDANDIKQKIGGIIHLAAITDVKFCENNPQKCFTTNVVGTIKALEIARKKNARFLYSSTSHVYGKPKKLPISETHSKTPASIYSTSKMFGEICCEAYANTYGLDVSIVRIFSVYGPNSPPHLVTSRIISQLDKKSIKMGNLSSKRDFIYVNDAIAAILTVFSKSKGFQIYNVGSGKSHSVLEVYKILKKISRKNTPIISVSQFKRKNDIHNMVSNITKIKKLGWKPTFSLEIGLKNTYQKYNH